MGTPLDVVLTTAESSRSKLHDHALARLGQNCYGYQGVQFRARSDDWVSNPLAARSLTQYRQSFSPLRRRYAMTLSSVIAGRTRKKLTFRYWPGVSPRRRRKHLLRWLWSQKPAASATSTIGTPERRRFSACRTRTSVA